MTEMDYYEQFERSTKARLAARKAILEADAELELLEIRKSLGMFSDTDSKLDLHKENVAELVGEFEHEITVEMLRFMDAEHRPTTDVATFLEVGDSTVKRLIRGNIITSAQVSGIRGHAISTISVVRHMLNNGPTC